MTDPIADLLTRIRNAGQRKMKIITLPHSRMKETIVKILKENNFIVDYAVRDHAESIHKDIVLTLRYEGKVPAIQNLKRVSKPGIRKYVGYAEIPTVLGGIGMTIISTSHGVMTGKQARKEKLGGELLCTIY